MIYAAAMPCPVRHSLSANFVYRAASNIMRLAGESPATGIGYLPV